MITEITGYAKTKAFKLPKAAFSSTHQTTLKALTCNVPNNYVMSEALLPAPLH